MALKFAFGTNGTAQGETDDKVPLLLEINVIGDEQLFFLGSDATSAYPREQEVLLQDGAVYNIVSFSEVERVDPND